MNGPEKDIESLAARWEEQAIECEACGAECFERGNIVSAAAQMAEAVSLRDCAKELREACGLTARARAAASLT